MCGIYHFIVYTSNLVSFLCASPIFHFQYRSSFFELHSFFLNRTCDSYCTYTTFRGKTITIDMCTDEKMNSLLDEQSSCRAVELHFIFSQ